ncbi:hypothetical protein THMIRHAM_18600 [Thiomicrorhabdus immobilis]|uniref:Uncharacterized protein n=1 Tax=Thiomicrorhabdus immobilis TaxID=2791037 RepID=A0ABM7MF75_9GAMM|nr:hypothetical protein THMIRHAM_18600 [Thiomicrorhabdus immobilis]
MLTGLADWVCKATELFTLNFVVVADSEFSTALVEVFNPVVYALCETGGNPCIPFIIKTPNKPLKREPTSV